jgi:fructosamine-3-kinase
MNAALRSALERALGLPVERAERVSGGDVNEAYRVELSSGRDVFVKANPAAPRGMFEAEARGLAWLGEAEALRVPEVLAVGEAQPAAPAFLALEYVPPGPPLARADEELGRGLAALHSASPGAFGLDHDNFVAVLPQSNAPGPTWAELYGERRLRPQTKRAVDAGCLPPALGGRLDAVIRKLPDLVGPAEPPARLHGDLWSGNVLHAADGEPCLVDPAVYGGHREIDLAMMRLFGGFSERCFAAYDESYPLAPGYEERVALYQLYPLLVHVNLFGGGYVGSVERALSRYV